MDRPPPRLIRLVLFAVVVMATLLGGCSEDPPATTTPSQSASGPGSGMGPAGTDPSSAPVDTASPVVLPTATGAGDICISDMAWQAVADGDYALAIPLFLDAIRGAERIDMNRLYLGLGRAYLENDQYREAVEALTIVNVDALDREDALVTLGSLAQAYRSAGVWEKAIQTYRRLLDLDDSAAPLIRLRIAKAYAGMDQYAEAVRELQAIDLSGLSATEKALILEELASALVELENYDAAAAAYDSILAFAQYDSYRSVLLQKRGEALLQAGHTEAAREAFYQVIDQYPSHTGAYLALVALDSLEGSEVSDLVRGIVLYHAWNFRESLSALRRYQLGQPDGVLDKAHYYTGLAYQALGQHDDAIDEFDRVIEYYPQSAYLPGAWMAKATSLSAQGHDPSDWYAEFVTAYPDGPRAPESLWLAAEHLEAQEDWEGAAHYYQRLRLDYPHDSGAPEAYFREGLAAYAAGDYDTAIDVWTGALDAAQSNTASTRLLTWLGLANRRAGHEKAAIDCWLSAIEQDPESYYGLRARDLLTGVRPILPAEVPNAVGGDTLDAEDWQEITVWVQSWAQADPAQVIDLTSSAMVQRALVEWTLGWHTDATDTLTLFRQTIADDPHALVAFALLCYDHGITPMSIWAADRLRYLGRAAGAGAPPLGLYRLAYPTKYGHLISAECHSHAVDASLFLALVRQESRFDPRSQSWAGALGLTQVMPATGEDIATAIGPADYRYDMLKRPVISVRFGVYYLAQMLYLCDRDWMAAIASYNGGYGNVTSWTNLPIADHDLFYEMIPFDETKSYIRLLYTNYRLYQAIYP